MNVALCFSGGVKYPNNGLNSLKKIFPNCNIKIFMHTWDIHKKSDYLKTVHGIKHKEVQKTVITNFDFLSKFLYENLLIENYDTKQIEFQSFYDELKFKDYPTTSDGKTIGIGMISMHYSIWKSNELKKYYEKEHDMKFDVVVRMRYDSEFPETINFLEYDDERSGDFAPLKHMPSGKNVVLGLVTTKRGDLETSDHLKRRVEEATDYVPLEKLALSPQCGFASVDIGNKIDFDAQIAKLELVVRTAEAIWGE